MQLSKSGRRPCSGSATNTRNVLRVPCASRRQVCGLSQWIGTQRLVSQTLQTEDELYEQAEVVRQQCLDEGWVEES